MSERINFENLYNTFLMKGWGSVLNGNEFKTYTTLFNYLFYLCEGVEIQNLKNGMLFLDVAIGSDLYAEQFKMKRQTLSKCVHTLARYGLIELDEGGKGIGIARVYFPIDPDQIPKPKNFKIPLFYKQVIQSISENDIKFIEREKVDYSSECIEDYKINSKESLQEKRIKISNQYLILLAKKEIDFEETKAKKVIKKFLQDYGDFYFVQKVILELYNSSLEFKSEKEVLKNLKDKIENPITIQKVTTSRLMEIIHNAVIHSGEKEIVIIQRILANATLKPEERHELENRVEELQNEGIDINEKTKNIEDSE
ncbi:hypothetical protein CHH83_17250 [Bacillus sp. 7586-K]|nr:hypothetical protein CHH83_17250 [Bacillus sp. 7586-K]